MAEREVECFSEVKTAQNSKTEGGTERQKKQQTNKMWSWRKKMCLGRFHFEKNQKNAPWNSALQRWLHLFFNASEIISLSFNYYHYNIYKPQKTWMENICFFFGSPSPLSLKTSPMWFESFHVQEYRPGYLLLSVQERFYWKSWKLHR